MTTAPLSGEPLGGPEPVDGRAAGEGRVVKAYSGWYDVMVDGRIWSANPRGRLRLSNQGILTGDRVKVSMGDDDSAMIEEILPRRNVLERPQVANVDQVLVVFTLADPPLIRPLVDRIMVLAESKSLIVLPVLNKSDLANAAQIEELKRIYRTAGYELSVTNALSGEGIADLKRHLGGKVSVMAGPSGVGKSAILNALEPNLNLRTGAVSAKLQRGRHTTRHSQLLVVETAPEPGFVVDTPGFSRLHVADVDRYELAWYFPEMRPAGEPCRFDDCLHRHEPGCRVKERMAAGEVDPVRYQHYLDLLAEIETADEQKYR
ncbi:MAG: ribosome small subunit-dependent GTPase A [Thermaerobacterales bacterium]